MGAFRSAIPIILLASLTLSGCNSGGSSSGGETSKVQSASPAPAPTVPSTPTGLTATAGNAQVALSWNAVSGATGYKVYRDTTLIGSPTSTSFTYTGLANGTTYTYRVSATNAVGEGAKSSATTATPQAPATVPAAPTGVTVTPGDVQVALSWNTVSSATNYKVYRNTTLIASPTSNSFTHTGLTNGTTYTYQISATNSIGEGAKSASVSATPQAPVVSGSWPAVYNTGYPHGLPGDTRTPVTLTAYTGPCDIRTDNTVIDGKLINCSMLIYAQNVIIRNSKVNGFIKTNIPCQNCAYGSITIEDTEIDGGSDHSEALGVENVTARRVNVYGNQHTVHCGDNCTVEDSWLHDQYDGAAMGWHQNAFITNGGTNHLIRHNTLHCRGGCTADVGLIPDGDISHVTIENNLFMASPDSSYCAYGGSHSGNKSGTPSYIIYRNNVFQRGSNNKCATYGPVTYFDTSATGNQWINNTWEDGTAVPPVF